MKNSIAWLIDRMSARILLAVLLASLSVVTLARPAVPARAAPQTQVFVTPAGRVNPETNVAFLNGLNQSMDVRVKDVQYATGLGAFEFTISFDPAVASILSVTPGPVTPSFLGSTGRTPNCTAAVINNIAGTVNYSCATQGSTPNGPLGSGVLATITFHPGAIGSTSLAFTLSTLTDITGTVDIGHAHKPLTDSLLVAKCGDFNADSVVTIGDILLMILRFGSNAGPPPSANWDARFDVNNDGAVTIGDILIEVQEFGRACTP